MRRGENGWRRALGRSKRGAGLAVLGLFLVTASVALALNGLQNPGFEDGLDNWEVHTERGNESTRQIVYGAGGTKGEPVPCDSKPYGICVVGTDTFQYFTENGPGEIATQTVSPVEGDKMLRLGGPFGSRNVAQNRDRLVVQQTFTVDPSNPVLQLNYNVFTFDYSGYDELEFRATLTDEEGDLITSRMQGSFASGTGLKTTGWRPNSIDLSPYAGQQVHIRISSGGTQDELYGFWAYVDAGLVPTPPVSGEQASTTAPSLPGGGTVNLNKYVDQNTGQSYFTVPSSQVAQFPSGCMPLTYTVPINPGAGTVSNVALVLNGNRFPMTHGSGNDWTGGIDCARNGDLSIEYDLTENATTQHFIVPLGGLVLIDPQGVVYNAVAYNAAIAAGRTPAQARAETAISGATVTLQRKVGGSFVNVLSGDPGIAPNVNPEITGSDGLYQWDVAAGDYRVVVTKPGYVDVTSHAVTVPPPVTDLHIAMTPVTTPSNPNPPNPPAPPVGGPPRDTTAPDTSISKAPKGALKAKKKKATAKFAFSSSEENSTFECKLDKSDWKPCAAAMKVKAGKGKHTLQVRAIDAAGNADPTPATAKFKVKAAKKKK